MIVKSLRRNASDRIYTAIYQNESSSGLANQFH